LYDDEAIEGSDANEELLGFDPLKGDWRMSLPCPADDLGWALGALKKHSTRITARDRDTPLSEDASATATVMRAQGLVFDPKGFLGS
jgi:hypothetical protein